MKDIKLLKEKELVGKKIVEVHCYPGMEEDVVALELEGEEWFVLYISYEDNPIIFVVKDPSELTCNAKEDLGWITEEESNIELQKARALQELESVEAKKKVYDHLKKELGLDNKLVEREYRDKPEGSILNIQKKK